MDPSVPRVRNSWGLPETPKSRRQITNHQVWIEIREVFREFRIHPGLNGSFALAKTPSLIDIYI